MRHRFPLRFSRLPLAIGASLLMAATGCSGRSSGRVHEAGADQKVHIQLDSGPLDELTVLRDTDGRFVVAGVCLFPEGTRLNISVSDSAGREIGRSQTVVEHALIQSLPVGHAGEPATHGRYVVRLEATFVAGLQSGPVMREMGNGERYQGEGMTRTRQGRMAYERKFEVRL